MPRHGQIVSEEEVRGAGWEGVKGAVHGAAVWGIPTLLALVVGTQFNRTVRRLTFQFKVYLLSSGMIVGSVVEADRRMRAYEVSQRRFRRVRKEQELWRSYEADILAQEMRASQQQQQPPQPQPQQQQQQQQQRKVDKIHNDEPHDSE